MAGTGIEGRRQGWSNWSWKGSSLFVGVSVAVCALLGLPHSIALRAPGLLTWLRVGVLEHGVEVNRLLWPSFERHTVSFPLHSGQLVKKVGPESREGGVNFTSIWRLVNEFADIV